MKNCKECINSRLVVSENGYHAVCTLSDDADVYDCLSNDKSRFEGNPLYLMCGGNQTDNEVD